MPLNTWSEALDQERMGKEYTILVLLTIFSRCGWSLGVGFCG
jgi:hypothetical protein